MEQVLTKALAFVAVIALGYFLKKRGFFKPHDYELIAKIVLNITLPCAVITSFAAFKMDYTLFILTLIGFCGNLLMIAWGFILTRYQTNAAKIFTYLIWPVIISAVLLYRLHKAFWALSL